METLGEKLETMPRVPLADDHVAMLRELGTEREYASGEMVAEAGVTKWNWEAEAEDENLKAAVETAAKDGLVAAYAIANKLERQDAVAY